MTNDLIARREAVLGPNVPTFYEKPLHLIRGEGGLGLGFYGQ